MKYTLISLDTRDLKVTYRYYPEERIERKPQLLKLLGEYSVHAPEGQEKECLEMLQRALWEDLRHQKKLVSDKLKELEKFMGLEENQ